MSGKKELTYSGLNILLGVLAIAAGLSGFTQGVWMGQVTSYGADARFISGTVVLFGTFTVAYFLRSLYLSRLR